MPPPPPALDDFPSSPSSASSPDSFLHPHLGNLARDDIGKINILPKSRNMHDPFEFQDPAAYHFPWEHTAIVDPDQSRYSMLIHEVSLLVGLAPDDLSSDDSHSLVPDRLKQVPDILPLSLSPAKSLDSRRRWNTTLPHPTDTDTHLRPRTTPTVSSSNPRPTNSIESAVPFARHRSAGVRPSPPLTRRQGQVFQFELDAPVRHAADLDETFIHPREPPPKPPVNSPADRCSSLDRLEQSLLKLEAHAPRKHRKSQSEERPPDYVANWKARRPSLPPPRRLRREQSNHEIVPRNPSRPVHHFSDCPPLPGSIPLHHNVASKTGRAVPPSEDRTPGSFMDMDETAQKRHTSFRPLPGKEKMKNLVRAAKTASRGVITWGKHLTGSPKSPTTGHETAGTPACNLSVVTGSYV